MTLYSNIPNKTMKADISITKSKKGTEIILSSKKINKYGIIPMVTWNGDKPYTVSHPFLNCLCRRYGEFIATQVVLRNLFSQWFPFYFLYQTSGPHSYLPLQRADTDVAIPHGMLSAVPFTGRAPAFVWHDKWKLRICKVRHPFVHHQFRRYLYPLEIAFVQQRFVHQ